MGADGSDHDNGAASALFGHLLCSELGGEIRTQDVDLLDLGCLRPAVLEEGLVEDYAGACHASRCQSGVKSHSFNLVSSPTIRQCSLDLMLPH